MLTIVVTPAYTWERGACVLYIHSITCYSNTVNISDTNINDQRSSMLTKCQKLRKTEKMTFKVFLNK